MNIIGSEGKADLTPSLKDKEVGTHTSVHAQASGQTDRYTQTERDKDMDTSIEIDKIDK